MSAGYSRETARWTAPRVPLWKAVLGRAIVVLQRLGFVVGAWRVLVVPGRRSGVPRSTLVAVQRFAGQRYIVAGPDDGDWVRDGRAAGRGILCRGRLDEHVALIELPLDARIALLSEPGALAAMTRRRDGEVGPDALPAFAARATIFRVDRC